MKKITTLLIPSVLTGAFCVAFTACNDTSQTSEIQGEDVPFVEYSFTEGATSGEEISARWVNLNYSNSVNGKILVINSNTELAKYVEGDYPPVDFSEKTLVLAYGCGSGVLVADGHKFQYLSGHNYAITINLILTAAASMNEWQVAIIVDKLSSNSNVKLNTTILNLP